MERDEEKIRKAMEYEEAKRAYYENALKFLGEGNIRKASEFLWGSIAMQIKLLALVKKNQHLGSHGQISSFIKGLSKELQDEEMLKSFEFLQRLHINFYDEVIDPEVFMLYVKEARKFLEKIERIIKAN